MGTQSRHIPRMYLPAKNCSTIHPSALVFDTHPDLGNFSFLFFSFFCSHPSPFLSSHPKCPPSPFCHQPDPASLLAIATGWVQGARGPESIEPGPRVVDLFSALVGKGCFGPDRAGLAAKEKTAATTTTTTTTTGETLRRTQPCAQHQRFVVPRRWVRRNGMAD